MIKKFIPQHIKASLHQLKGAFDDVTNGYFFHYAKRKKSFNTFSRALKIKQVFFPNEAKKKNLQVAIQRIESIQINSNEIFSFWRITGPPSKKNGYVESRSLVNGNLEKSLGGGLCQLSGLIYYVSLCAKLEVLERHNHSADIYTDETRFTPLGSDATVAYGYKDLKIRNNLKHPIKFTFSIDEKYITIELQHSSPIENNIIEFKESVVENNRLEVITLVNNQEINRSVYKKYMPIPV